MVTINFVHTKGNEHVENIACFVPQDADLSKDITQLAQRYFTPLKEHFEQLHFSGQLGRTVVIPVQKDEKITTLLFIGLGKKSNSDRDIEQFRRAVGSLIKAMQSRKINSCVVYMPSIDLFSNVTYSYLAEQATISANMAAYRFDDYITDATRKVNKDLALTFIADSALQKDIEEGIRKGSIIAQSVNQVRHWVDLPPSVLTPSVLVKRAQTIAQEHGLGITVFNEETIKKMGMGGLAAVSAGSHEDCALIILEYKTEKKNAPTIAFVGKGITFDSGGLSLKPATSMETMKDDMSGAAVVINVLQGSCATQTGR